MKKYKKVSIIHSKVDYEQILSECESSNKENAKYNEKCDTIELIVEGGLLLLWFIMFGLLIWSSRLDNDAVFNKISYPFVFYSIAMLFWIVISACFHPGFRRKSVTFRPLGRIEISYTIIKESLTVLELNEKNSKFELIVANKDDIIEQFDLLINNYETMFKKDLKAPIINFDNGTITLPY